MILRLLVSAIHALFAPPPPKRTDAEIDAKLLERSKTANYQGLDPINSIVDLMKLFDLDSSIEARRELWMQMHLDGDFTGTAEQNQLLIVEFRKQLAQGDFGF